MRQVNTSSVITILDHGEMIDVLGGSTRVAQSLLDQNPSANFTVSQMRARIGMWKYRGEIPLMWRPRIAAMLAEAGFAYSPDFLEVDPTVSLSRNRAASNPPREVA